MKLSDDRAAKVAEWKHLTEQVLPMLAKEYRWPLRLDHCFKRICLDFAFGDVWYRHVQKPAERHISPEALERAIACAREIAEQGEELLSMRNQASLCMRRQARQQVALAETPKHQHKLHFDD